MVPQMMNVRRIALATVCAVLLLSGCTKPRTATRAPNSLHSPPALSKTGTPVLPTTPVSSSSNLVSRFARLSCAVVQIGFDGGEGTGFFIDRDGRLVTAAHIVLNTSYSEQQGQLQVSLVPKNRLRIRTHDGRVFPISLRLTTDADGDRATADLAVIETGVPSPCYLELGDADSSKVGEHLISVGYPGTSPALTLYDGFLSSRHAHLPIPIGHVGSKPVYPNYEVFRVQMPITPGSSGSPVISDDDKVVAVISEVPVIWLDDLSKLIQAMMERPGGSGVLLSGFDTTKLLAQLAWIVQQFESPGSGFAVPVSYLKLAAASNRMP
jgi:S1-C subfamily serine protease